MMTVAGRVWGWVSPANLYSSWGSKTKPETPSTIERQTKSRWGLWGLASWVWKGENTKKDQKTITEEFWETEENFKPLEVEELRAMRPDVETKKVAQSSSRWWRRMLPSTYFFWPRWWSSSSTGLCQQKCAGWNEGTWDSEEVDGQSDYGTPPPSPTPFSQKSAFRFFSRSWTGEIVPEHYEICFNFLRHLFDLFVVGFLSTVSPPTKVILDVLGVQGALKLWLHGMAMFLVSSVGMAGLLWVVQEYLPQFALIYGIVQALVISVSVCQSEALAEGDDGKGDGEVKESEEEQDDMWEKNEPQKTADESNKEVKKKKLKF